MYDPTSHRYAVRKQVPVQHSIWCNGLVAWEWHMQEWHISAGEVQSLHLQMAWFFVPQTQMPLLGKASRANKACNKILAWSTKSSIHACCCQANILLMSSRTVYLKWPYSSCVWHRSALHHSHYWHCKCLAICQWENWQPCVLVRLNSPACGHQFTLIDWSLCEKTHDNRFSLSVRNSLNNSSVDNPYKSNIDWWSKSLSPSQVKSTGLSVESLHKSNMINVSVLV